MLKKVPASFHCAVTSCAGRERLSLLFSQEGKLTTLIETRGNGGLILCAPGDGYELIQGDYTQLSVLTVEEREILLNAAWHFDEKPITGSSTEPISLNSTNENDFSDCSSGSFALRPGDDYDARGDVREILIKHGWTSLSFRGDREDWKRPGKEGNGISATLQNGYFYVFSTNAAPFEANQGYAPHRVYALLEHNGDFTAAANALMEEGYGQSNPILENIDEIVANLTHKKEKKNVFTAAELLRTFTSLNEPVIDGLLRRTEVMNVVAAPKSGTKTQKSSAFVYFKNIRKGYFMSENTISPDIECCECDSCVDCQYFLYFWGECQEALPAHIIKNYGFCVYNAPECGNPIAPGNFAAEGLIPIVHKSFRCRHLTSDDGDHFYDQ